MIHLCNPLWGWLMCVDASPPEDCVRCALSAFRAVILMQHLRRWTQKGNTLLNTLAVGVAQGHLDASCCIGLDTKIGTLY